MKDENPGSFPFSIEEIEKDLAHWAGNRDGGEPFSVSDDLRQEGARALNHLYLCFQGDDWEKAVEYSRALDVDIVDELVSFMDEVDDYTRHDYQTNSHSVLKAVQEGRRDQHKYKYIDVQVGRDVLVTLVAIIHRGKVSGVRSKIESMGLLERMDLVRLLQETDILANTPEGKKVLDLLEGKNMAAGLDLLADEEFLESHPHFYKLNKDKVSNFKYFRTTLFGMNKAYQVRRTTIMHQGEAHSLPGDWYITITKKLLIVTCQGFPFPNRIPIIVKPWKINDRSTVITQSVSFEDCDRLKWKLWIIPGVGTGAGAILEAYDSTGNESMNFNMEGRVKV